VAKELVRLGANVVFACRDVDRANKAIARIAAAITPSNALHKNESKFGIPVLPLSAKRLWQHIFHSIQWNNELSLLLYTVRYFESHASCPS
jgi:hypothetical protein